MKLKILVVFALAISLSGCGWVHFGKQEISCKPVERVELNLPELAPLSLDPLVWTIITERNSEQVFSLMEKNKQEPVLFGVTATGYENLAVNWAKLMAYIKTQKETIEIYKEYYERINSTEE